MIFEEEKKPVRGLGDGISNKERIILILFRVLLFGVMMGAQAYLASRGKLSADNINDASMLKLTLMYSAAGVFITFFILYKYLRDSFDRIFDDIRGILKVVLMAFLIQFLLNMAVMLAAGALKLDLASPPNNQAVIGLADTSYRTVFVLTVVLAPILEETLYRAAIYGGLLRFGRAPAYILSILLFAGLHVFTFVLGSGDLSMLRYLIVYIPASFALTWCYEKSGNIWAPIIMHTLSNLLAMYTLKATGMM
ncbi:MAG: CPBP family intramembrane metalloprotease [Ruminococcaceae bacterium]|nr:CPBP family intramembrane metalloprotease [Oscillospiraceae bacterium]